MKKYRFEEPSRDNVDVDDILVRPGPWLEMWPVTRTDDKFVYFVGGAIPYAHVIIFKPDGSHLVGGDIREKFEGSHKKWIRR